MFKPLSISSFKHFSTYSDNTLPKTLQNRFNGQCLICGNMYRYEKQEFVGLSNQGATCYMNSLLQTLYMTPEFRKELYRWVYDAERHGESADSIPLLLQLLFSRLQLSKGGFIDTTALTKSFQWDIRDSFQQHDVQEFCRVLFDAIEQSVSHTQQSEFIKQLYEGTYVDYVKCMACLSESNREDKFLDISLTVKNLSLIHI